ncbi:MAG TPA: MdtA/MuxA family multidrug efflux RND transporter periplasmic adaptor subunit, partial [Methylomirabilota bacterium]|nr:MdtA/MuxA family multidrug efflux RND transporter periplasmic adaptor subunit [Methylomirabilota bacterium]
QPRAGGRFSGGPMSVVTAPVQKGDMPVVLDALGTVTPLATVTVKTQISGHLVQIGFTEGQTVQKGDFLAEIDPRPYQIALEQAQAQLEKDQALLADAQIDLARYRKLVAQDSIAKQQADTQEYLVRQYTGTVAADQAQIDNAKLNLDYCHIVSPVAGRVGLRQVDEGNYVQPSDANGIVVITQMQPITVVFTLPEDDLPVVRKRLRAHATLSATAYDRSQTTELATGTLSTIDNEIDTGTGTVKLRAQFDNQDEALFPNQFVNVRLLVDELQNVALVPSAAIQRGAAGTFVYVVKPDDTVAVQPVGIGQSSADQVAITSGVSPGLQVVVDGADKLRDGAKVAVASASGSAQQASSTPPADKRTGRRRERAATGADAAGGGAPP